MKLNVITMLPALVLCIASVQQMDGETIFPSTPKPIVIKPTKPIGTRPKAPTRQQIECTYSDGNLYFLFAVPEGECQLSMTDLTTGEVVYTDFDSEASDPVYIGYHESGEISITTEQGNTYSGSW